MKKNKLTELLSGFKSNEVKRLKVFLNSPYFNNKPHLVKMFEIISRYHPDYESEKLTDENIFKQLFPGKKYNYSSFKNSISDLFKLAGEFLSIEELEKDKLAMKNYFILSFFGRQNLKDLFKKELKITEQLYEDEHLQKRFFENRFLFKKFASINSNVYDYGQDYENINDEIESYIEMSLNNLLTYGLYFRTAEAVQKENDNLYMVDRLIDTLNDIYHTNNPVNKSFCKLYQLMKTNDEKYFYEVIDILKNETEFLNNDDRLMVYQPLEAFLLKRTKNGEEKFYRPQFELYKHCFESGLYDNEELFIQVKLIGAIEPAIKVGEFKWIENAINKYKDRIAEEVKQDFYNLNMAKVLQAKGENEKALELLNKINLDTSHFKSLARNILLKIYYELGYYEQAKSQIDSYRHYIHREKGFSEIYKDSVYGFLKLYNKLIDLKIDNDSGKLQDLEFEAGKSQNIILKQWLVEKIDELTKKGAN